MFEHDPARGSTPLAERNGTVDMSATALAWYLIRYCAARIVQLSLSQQIRTHRNING